jgi:hypothetical protein
LAGTGSGSVAAALLYMPFTIYASVGEGPSEPLDVIGLVIIGAVVAIIVGSCLGGTIGAICGGILSIACRHPRLAGSQDAKRRLAIFLFTLSTCGASAIVATAAGWSMTVMMVVSSVFAISGAVAGRTFAQVVYRHSA